MAAGILTIDETTTGGRTPGPDLDFGSDEVTVRDIIEMRVRTEVDAFNQERSETFRGLVTPSESETRFNQPKPKARRTIDPTLQVDAAVTAFLRGTLIVLLPDKQAESLDETVRLATGDSVSFLRLIPLVGG